MRYRVPLPIVVLLALTFGMAAVASAGKPAPPPPAPAPGLYPDLRTVVPAHLNLVNEHQRDLLRFSNGIANTGVGPWAVRPEPPLGDPTTTTTAMQEIRDSNAFYRCGQQSKQVTVCHNVVAEFATSVFEFHPAHNHWHIGEVALFEVRKGSPTGPVVGSNSVKVTFCLIDAYKLDDNSPTSERLFWDCFRSHQGISAGWVDQYHQATDGQELDLTGVPNATDYFLVSTSNHSRIFRETDYTNNTAWVKFTLSGTGGGNRKVTVTGNSPCSTPGLCGARSTNR